ncbi:Serine acetyltransferase [Blochmannia endosymbiont of Camponotus (Colobopsis) obliquus]|nr:Serine acetyltransferase [Blochmannia endosymbiont of Camponotus (Colobopsis) obliquus]
MSVESLKFIWEKIQGEAQLLAYNEPVLAKFLHDTVLQHNHIGNALSYILSEKLGNTTVSANVIRDVIEEAYNMNATIIIYAVRDIFFSLQRDPVIDKYSTPFLYFKGFHALQAYRISHWLWLQDRYALAVYFQNRISVLFGVDIHPAARIGYGVMLDHATGIVIGETAVVANNVSILQSVTLGSTGKKGSGDRHPKIGEGVIIGAGAILLGNIEIGYMAKVGAGSVVLHSVPSCVTVAGIVARIVK